MRHTTIARIDYRVDRLPLHRLDATRRIEAAALAAVPPFALMARAGDAVARLAIAVAPHARRTVVFAGPGHNGGDGLEAAARLRAAGREVRVELVGDLSRLPADAAKALGRARDAGVGLAPFEAARGVDGADLAIDALLGIGASRAPSGDFAAAIASIARARAAGATVIAVDVPSGLDADRGQPLGEACVVADHTLTLLTLKPGLFTAHGRDLAGVAWHDTLGVDLAAQACDAWLIGAGSIVLETRRNATSKGSFGDVAVVGGAPGMAGAVWLAGRAASAAGAGRVFVDMLGPDTGGGVDPVHPELMHRPGWWKSDRRTLARSTVVCGCGGGDAVREALPVLLGAVPRLVLDADALNAIASDAGLVKQLAARAGRGQETVLTPHPLEAARLLDSDTAAIQADRLDAAVRLASRYAAVVVLKGSGTVVAAPDAVPEVHATGNASLATAGTGDVLAGWLGGRWRDGVAAVDAVRQAVAEHGAAAEPSAPGALRASDLIERLHRRSRGRE